MSNTDSQLHPIRVVSEITGVNSVTLRAWERRYGLITPTRTPKGHRLYSNQDIELIKSVCEQLEQGMSISLIAARVSEDGKSSLSDAETAISWKQYQDDMLRAIQRFDDRALDAIYNRANAIYPVDIVTNMLIVPLLERIGERWVEGTGSIAEEHFFSVYLRNKIGARFHHQNSQNQGHRLVAACLPGEQHEFGLLLFALSAHSRGYHITLLGADMPITELAPVIKITDANGVVLTGSAHIDCELLKEDIRQLAGDTEVPVFIGGDVIEHCIDVISEAHVQGIGSDITAGIAVINRTLNS